MNGLSDSLTIGLVLALVFGALFFYLYTRLSQAEKRVSLTENILLDLKMATENTLMAMGSAGNHGLVDHSEHEESQGRNLREENLEFQVKPISAPAPVDSEDVEQIPDEDYYKSILQQQHVEETTVPTATPVSTVDVNYESMTTKELKALVKQRGVAVPASAHKREIIDALKRGSRVANVAGDVLAGSSMSNEPQGFPVELGSNQAAENRSADQE